MLAQVVRDVVGIAKTLPAGQAARWYWHVLHRSPTILWTRQFWPADRYMTGALDFRYRGHRIRFEAPPHDTDSPSLFSGLREFFARDMYLGPFVETGFPYDRCLDLGCNIGAVSKVLSILGAGRNRVLAIDAQNWSENPEHREIAAQHPIEFVQGYVGDPSVNTHDLPVETCISPEGLLAHFGGQTINFLKMDIEGAEFDIIGTDDAWLERVENMAMEVHRTVANPAIIIRALHRRGFAVTWRGNHHTEVRMEDADFIYASRTGMLRAPRPVQG